MEGTPSLTYLLVLLRTGGVVTSVHTVWLDGDAAVVLSRTFWVDVLRFVGDGAAAWPIPTLFEDKA